jgi:hypothetical protein
MINFIKNYLKKRREIELAGLKRQLQAEEALTKLTGELYPLSLASLNRRIGELEKELSYDN